MKRLLAGLVALSLMFGPVFAGPMTALGAGKPPTAAPAGANFVTKTVYAYLGGAASGINFDVTGAVSGDLAVAYSINNGATGITLVGSGAMTQIASNGDAQGTNNQIFTGILNSTDISTHTFSVASGSIADYGVVIMIFHGATSIKASPQFQFLAAPATTLVFSSFTVDPTSKGSFIITHGSNSDVASNTASPGSWTLNVPYTALAGGYWSMAGGLGQYSSMTGASITVSGFGGSGGQGGYLFELLP